MEQPQQIPVDELLKQANEQHRTGRLLEASEIYLQILAIEPKHADALFLLGTLQFQVGRNGLAIQMIEQAIAIRPASPHYLNNLGYILAQDGQSKRAAEVLQHALTLAPDYADARFNYGLALANLGHAAPAIEQFRQAIRLRPDYSGAHYRLGNALRDSGQPHEAIAAYQRAIELEPGSAAIYNDMGIVLMQSGQTGAAQQAFLRAAQIAPTLAEAHNNLGAACTELGRIEEGLAAFREALSVRADYPDAQGNLATALVDSGRIDDGIAAYEQALALRGDFAQAHHQLGMTLLLKGDFARGWRECEWRLRLPAYALPPLPGKEWNGEPGDGRHIFIQAEQGFGDAIQFARYLPLLREKGFSKITLLCQPELLRLFQTLDGTIQFVLPGQALPAFDVYCAMLSQPYRFAATLETIPASVPYVRPDPLLVEKWKSRLNDDNRLKIGLAWAGSANYKNDRRRSLALSDLQPLANVRDVTFISLQKDAARSSLPFELHDWTSELNDFAQTAALIANLDLVITVDTAVAHLAGALGKPVWTMINDVPDWRWMLNRNDSPWYPTMRLFRQPQRGDWNSVIHDVAQHLARFSRLAE